MSDFRLRHLALFFLASFLVLCAACNGSPKYEKGAPDVYLVIIDALRADHLGVYGYPHPTSPRMDALAKRSLVFDKAHPTAPWTLPSIASMLTGHPPTALGIRDFNAKVDDSVTTLTELYKAQGYETAAVVSHVFLLPKFGLMQGMDKLDYHEVTRNPHMHISSPGVYRRAMKFVDEHVEEDPDRPLFMIVHFFDVHYNYFLHPEVYNPHPDYQGPVQSGMRCLLLRELVRKGLRPQDIQRISDLYDSEIRFTDGYVGKFIDGLKQRGRFDNALFVLVGDHGEELGDRPDKWVGHTKPMTEDVLHVPLIMKLPGGARAGQHLTEPVSLIDLMPTIASLTGLEIPAKLDIVGRPLDLDHPENNRDTLFAETGRLAHRQMVLHGTWKLWRDLDRKANPNRLYDLATDPGERRNVLAQHPDVAEELVSKLDAWSRAVQIDRSKLDPSVTVPPLSVDQEAALKAMGYLDDDGR